jgi:hypothetical protein
MPDLGLQVLRGYGGVGGIILHLKNVSDLKEFQDIGVFSDEQTHPLGGYVPDLELVEGAHRGRLELNAVVLFQLCSRLRPLFFRANAHNEILSKESNPASPGENGFLVSKLIASFGESALYK